MGRLIYSFNVSIDGFVETPDRGLEWATVDEELHGWFNDQMRSVEASLYGRRLYELMAGYWPTAEEDPEITPVAREFARLWKAVPKFVFSSTLEHVDHNSRLVSGDVGEILADIRREFSGDLEVGGPGLAGQFVRRGLVDEFHLVVHPVVLGAGTPFWPHLETPMPLRRLETRTFSAGAVLTSFTKA